MDIFKDIIYPTGAIGLVTKLVWDSCRGRWKSLKAVFNRTYVQLPPSFKEADELVKESLGERFSTFTQENKLELGLHVKLSEILSKFRKEYTQTSCIPYGSPTFHLFQGTIQNSSSEQCEDIKLQTGSSCIAVIRRVGNNKAEQKHFEGELALGNLHPREEIKIDLWFEIGNYDKINILHKKGIGYVSIFEHTNAVGTYFQKNFSFLLFWFLFGLGVVVIALIKSDKTSTPTSQATPTVQTTNTTLNVK